MRVILAESQGLALILPKITHYKITARHDFVKLTTDPNTHLLYFIKFYPDTYLYIVHDFVNYLAIRKQVCSQALKTFSQHQLSIESFY